MKLSGSIPKFNCGNFFFKLSTFAGMVAEK